MNRRTFLSTLPAAGLLRLESGVPEATRNGYAFAY